MHTYKKTEGYLCSNGQNITMNARDKNDLQK